MKNVLIAGSIVAGSWLCADTVCAMVFAAFRPEPPPLAVQHEAPLPDASDEPVRLAGFGEGRDEEMGDSLACPAGLQVLSAVAAEAFPDATVAAVRLKDELAVVQRGDMLLDSPVERVRVDESGVAEVLLRVNGTLVACRSGKRPGGSPEPAKAGVPVLSRTLADAIIRGEQPGAWAGIRVVPAFEKGKAIGFRLYGVAPSTEVARLGFRTGDVVKSVNGIVLQNPGDVFQAYPTLKDASSFDVAIVREGRDELLRVEVR